MTTETPFGYTGEMEDPNGLVYLRARYYSHNLGTFISQDPYEGNMNDPMSLNRYVYAHGNPVNNTDPSGMRVCSDLTQAANPTELRTCVRNVTDLRRNFGIRLREGEGLSDNLNNWTSQRINNLHAAVHAINAKLGGLTQQAIGDTFIRLESQSPGSEAARTTLCNVMSLFLNFSGASDHVHTVDNIIHEFGHVITLSPPVGRTANSEAIGPATEMPNRPVALWQQIQNYRAFDEGLGWNPEERENPSTIPAEVVADMFLYWVRGYPFTQDQDNIGQARSAFMNAGDIPGRDGNPLPRINDNTPINDGSIIRSAGITAWAGNASCPASGGASIPDTALADYPELALANNGWCNFT
jgi:RHS repeat-associated protein